MQSAGRLIVACALLYGGGALAGNTSPSMLDAEARARFIELLPGDMSDFVLHDEPRPFRDELFFDPQGKKVNLSVFEGSLTVLNFWAIWCAPCRVELPSLNDLNSALADEGVRVVTVSVDRGGQLKADGYLTENMLHNLDAYWDEKSALAKQMGVLGIPVTAILGPDAREIGRLLGDADWHSDEVVAMLRFLLDETGVRPGSEG